MLYQYKQKQLLIFLSFIFPVIFVFSLKCDHVTFTEQWPLQPQEEITVSQ